MEKTVKRWFPIFVLPTLAAFLIAFVIPFIMGVLLSFTEFRTVTDAQFVGFSNYIRAFTDDRLFIDSLIFTVKFAAVSVIGINVLAFALGVGTGLLSCGASVSRVEIAVERICLACGAKEVNVFALPSMVLCSIKVADGSEVSQMKRNFEVSNNFFKMEKYNQLSRDLCAHKLSLEEAERELDNINSSNWFKVPFIVLGGGVLAGAFSVFFGGALIDALPSALIGCLMAYLNILLSRRDFNAYARTFMLSLVGGFLAMLMSRALIACGVACSVSMVTIGTIMVVVPGLLICNAVRDLFSGPRCSTS